ncbi:MAG TPA: DUF790 family protein [Myxococcota bacterium]|nr:DUF790 family protein [Myxococcota bacterium]
MLTGDLVRVRSTREGVRPSFVKVEQRTLERAEEVLQLFHEGVEESRTRQELTDGVLELVGDGTDHKIWRGMAKLLSDKAEFVTEAPLPPVELRARLFGEVGAGPSRARAIETYARVAEELGSTPAVLRRLLFADRKEEQQIQALPVDDASWLVHRYNVALVQSVLLKATSLTVTLKAPKSERLRQLFRGIAFHRLMYRVQPIADGVRLELDGPASLLRLNTRYGMALANWFPALLLQDGAWELEAEVRWTRRRLRKKLVLSSEQGLVSHYQDKGAWRSRTEEWFLQRFQSLDSGWTIEDGTVLDLGGQGVVCPSFTFRKGRRRAHLEIVGFWRKAWLQRRLELLERHGPGTLVLAVSTRLEGAKQGLGRFAGQVVSFKEVVPAKDVLALIEEIAV